MRCFVYLIVLVFTLLPQVGFGQQWYSQCVEAEWPDTTLSVSCTSDYSGTCKYDFSDVAYDSMSYTFDSTGGTTHTEDVELDCGGTYTIYVKCSSSDAGYSFTVTIDKDPPPRRIISVH